MNFNQTETLEDGLLNIQLFVVKVRILQRQNATISLNTRCLLINNTGRRHVKHKKDDIRPYERSLCKMLGK